MAVGPPAQGDDRGGIKNECDPGSGHGATNLGMPGKYATAIESETGCPDKLLVIPGKNPAARRIPRVSPSDPHPGQSGGYAGNRLIGSG